MFEYDSQSNFSNTKQYISKIILSKLANLQTAYNTFFL